ncbi:MAG: carboxypeptidase-like regulatory domain-containing protein [Terracidiphilus sp.]|jgi:hypothetical protein
MRAAQLIVLAGITIPHLLSGQCKALVGGMVIDESGNPLSSVKVSFIEDKVYDYQQLPRASFLTDVAGNFSASVAILSPGRFWVMARKPDDGYPDNRLMFYLDREPPKVLLSCEEPRSGIVVQLGPKVAYVRQLTILDAETGSPVENAGITLRRMSRPVGWTRLDALFLKMAVSGNALDLKLAVPSEVDISYEISAPGYETSPRTILHLKPSQDVNLEVTLQRSSQSTTQSP